MSASTDYIPTIAEHVRDLVAAAPRLTDEQIITIRYHLVPGAAASMGRQEHELMDAATIRENERRRKIEHAKADLERVREKFQEALTGCRGCDIPKSKHHFATRSSSLSTHEYEPLSPLETIDVANEWQSRIAKAEHDLSELEKK